MPFSQSLVVVHNSYLSPVYSTLIRDITTVTDKEAGGRRPMSPSTSSSPGRKIGRSIKSLFRQKKSHPWSTSVICSCLCRREREKAAILEENLPDRSFRDGGAAR